MLGMLFDSAEVKGLVVHPPHHEFLSSRQLTRGSRNVPRTTMRVQTADGSLWTILYTGEMVGQAVQGDYITANGFRRRYGVLVANEIWLAGYTGADGEFVAVPAAVRIARKQVLF